VLVAVGDDIVADDDTSCFGATVGGGASAGAGISGGGAGASCGGGGGGAGMLIGLAGLIGLLTFVGFVTDFTQLLCVSTHAPEIG